MTLSQKIILVVSRDHGMADVRSRVLARAGFKVIPAMNMEQLKAALLAHRFDGALIGYSIPPAEKRRIWAEMKRHRIPTLELHQDGVAHIREATHHASKAPDDFLNALENMLKLKLAANKPPKRKQQS